MDAVVCLRGGDDTSLPKVSVVSPQQYLARLRESDSEDAEEQAEREANYAVWSRGLGLFDLAPKEYSFEAARKDRVDEVGATYFWDEREVVIIDRDQPLTDAGAVSLLAHEFVHALQDRELDLRKYQERYGDTFDAELAVGALIEGEATLYQLLVAVELGGRSADEIDWMRLFSDWQSDTLLESEEDEAPVALASMRFPYAFGGGFVAQHWLARGRAGIDRLFDSPPRTTSEILFGSDRSELADAREELAEHAWPALPERFDERYGATLGAWIARIHAARQRVTVTERLEPAQSLAADYFTVQRDADSGTVVSSWRVRTTFGSARQWPGLESARFDITDVADPEAILIAAEPDLSEELDALEWRSKADVEESEESESDDARGLFRELPYRACAVGRPSGW